MSMARKIAGVTKDDSKVLETLESRFGMFLASNTSDAQFSIQCIGLASTTTHMELADDSGSHEGCHDTTANALMDEFETVDAELAAVEAVEEKQRFRKSLEQLDHQGEFLLKTLSIERDIVAEKQTTAIPPQHATLRSEPTEPAQMETADDAAGQRTHQNVANRPLVQQISSEALEDLHENMDEFSKVTDGDSGNSAEELQDNTENGDSTIAGRLSKGAAIIRDAMRKVNPATIMSQLGNNTSGDSLRLPQQQQSSIGNSSSASNISAISGLAPSRSDTMGRAESGAGVLIQTRYEDLGQGNLPTVHISSRPGGHFDGTLRMTHEEVEAHRRRQKEPEALSADAGGHPKFLRLHAHHQDMPEPTHGIVNLIEQEGISVISDIDDTIKETNVTAGARIILRNTFLKEMQEVEGMAAVYKSWWDRGAAIHYVSNSPWQLIPSLLQFFHTHMFPPGSAHLRMHDSMLKTYFMTPGENKRRCIGEILSDFPDRKFILVGDSGEIDMEIYTEMAVKHPGQILKIFIRDITTARLRELAKKMAPSRSRSFSSLRLPKASPITTAVSSGFGLFSRRASQVNLSFENNENGGSAPNLTTTSNVSLNCSQENEGVARECGVPHGELIAFSRSEHSQTEANAQHQVGMVRDMDLGALEYHGGPLAPKLDASGPLEPSAASSTIPATLPRHDSSQISMSNVKTVTSTLFNSPLIRSPSDKKSLNTHGWSAVRSRVKSSPVSSLSENARALAGFPFPTAASFSTHGDASGDGSHARTRSDENYEGNEYPSRSILDHQQQWTSNIPLSSSPASTPAMTPTMTPIAGPTPSNTPPMSPGIPILGVRGAITGNRNGAAIAFPGSISPSSGYILKPPSFSTSPSQLSVSVSASKTPLEVWLDRVNRCQRQLPQGVLTLFEGAHELENCGVVQEMFENYGEESSERDDHADDDEKDYAGSLEVELGPEGVPGLVSSYSTESVSSVDTGGHCHMTYKELDQAQQKQHNPVMASNSRVYDSVVSR
ncbi:hypothetical protein BGX28_004712 [Mortierella sp. GBA30]|nr:hypothetical protein BGX28_004712 [Mortierella sp. GBA30]